MTDSYRDAHQQTMPTDQNRNNDRGGFRGGRGPGNRDSGGFRIRLSDNEMRSARSLQEAFNLRSTVAVLGFALRTLGQMLEEGKLEELITEQRQTSRNNGKHREKLQGSRGGQFDSHRQDFNKGAKPNPFARPPKPEPQPEKGIETSEATSSTEESPNSQEATDQLSESQKPINDGTKSNQEAEQPSEDSTNQTESINNEITKEASSEND